jgi:MFS family permease
LANLVHGWNSHGARAALVPLFVAASLADSPAQAARLTGLVMALGAAAQVACVWPAGLLVDRVGRRMPMAFGALVSAVALAMVPFCATWQVLAGVMAIYGVGSALLGTAPAALVGDATAAIDAHPAGGLANETPAAGGAGNAKAVAVFSMCGDAGSIIGPLVAGALTTAVSFQVAFGLGAVLWLVSAALSATLPRTRAGR